MSDKQWYPEYQAELKAQQEGKSREEIKEELKTKADFVFDPETAPKQGHRWINRGMKMTCEDAGHSYHEAWKRR